MMAVRTEVKTFDLLLCEIKFYRWYVNTHTVIKK